MYFCWIFWVNYFEKNFSMRFINISLVFVDTFLLYGELNHILFHFFSIFFCSVRCECKFCWKTTNLHHNNWSRSYITYILDNFKICFWHLKCKDILFLILMIITSFNYKEYIIIKFSKKMFQNYILNQKSKFI